MNTAPSRLGPFAIEERLGGLLPSRTFRAVHVARRVTTALRLLPHDSIQGAAAVRGFLEEIEELKPVVDPNCVRCLGGAVESGWPYVVYEWVPGESLTAQLERRGKLPWESAIDLVQGVCQGVSAAHDQNILHGRITPDKVLIDASGVAKLTGFATTRIERVEGQSHNDLPPHDAAYLAPEQWNDPPTVIPQTDVYAIGCLLFHMLTGHTPHSAVALSVPAEMDPGQTIRTVSSLEMTCPVWLDVLVERLLAPQPDNRLASVREISEALAEAQRHMASGVGTAQRAMSRKKSSLVRDDDKEELHRIRRRRVRKRDDRPFYERPWFLAVCLSAIVGCIAWALWPLGEDALFEQAVVLMESGETSDWRRARDDYLLPLQQRFPEGQYAKEVAGYLDQIAMEKALNKMKLNTQFNRLRSCVGERRFAAGWEYEKMGDRLTAIARYRSLVEELKESEQRESDEQLENKEVSDRTYVLLARRQIAEIIGRFGAGGEPAMVEHSMSRAAKLADEIGDQPSARRIWTTIVAMYDGNPHYASAVETAKGRLATQ